MTAPRFRRFVAIGDSTAEGLQDPDGRGGHRGWADRLAERLAASEEPGAVGYANLAIRGRLAAQVRDEQLGPALALQPDLVGISAGLNDALRPGFEPDAVGAVLEEIQRPLVDAGATVVCFTMPDPGPLSPLARFVRGRIFALNVAVRAAAERTGTIVVDFERHPAASDPRLWSADRLHASSEGHVRIAGAIAEALGLPDADGAWAEPLPPVPARRPHQLVLSELVWSGRYLAPWVFRRVRGRSSGDGITAKLPDLVPVKSPTARGSSDARRPHL